MYRLVCTYNIHFALWYNNNMSSSLDRALCVNLPDKPVRSLTVGNCTTRNRFVRRILMIGIFNKTRRVPFHAAYYHFIVCYLYLVMRARFDIFFARIFPTHLFITYGRSQQMIFA